MKKAFNVTIEGKGVGCNASLLCKRLGLCVPSYVVSFGKCNEPYVTQLGLVLCYALLHSP